MSGRVTANEACGCPEGRCAEFFGEDDRGQCVYRVAGELAIQHCPKCCETEKEYRWHRDGRCLGCAGAAREEGR